MERVFFGGDSAGVPVRSTRPGAVADDHGLVRLGVFHSQPVKIMQHGRNSDTVQPGEILIGSRCIAGAPKCLFAWRFGMMGLRRG